MIKFLAGVFVGAALIVFLDTLSMWHAYNAAAPCCVYAPSPFADIPPIPGPPATGAPR